MRAALFAGALALLNAPAVAASDNPSLNTWAQTFPDPARVNADIAVQGRGQDPLIIAARQRGTLNQLYAALTRLSGSLLNDPNDTMLAGHKPPRSVTAKRRAYWDAIIANQNRWYPQLEKQTNAPCDGKPRALCKRARYMDTSGTLEYSQPYARELAQRYFPASMREAYVSATVPPTPPPSITKPAPHREKTLADWIAIVFGFGLAAFVIAAIVAAYRRRQGGEGDKVSGHYGTADYAPLREGLENCESLFQGVFLGRSSRPGRDPAAPSAPIITTPESHTLIVARTGTGKNTSVIEPTLLLYKSSIVVIDPKGENAAITARYRRDQLGHDVHIVNPWGIFPDHFKDRGFAPAMFNPLDLLDRTDPNVVSVALSLAASINGATKAGGEYWRDSAIALLTGILLWVTETPGETKTLNRVADIIAGGADAEDLRTTLIPYMIKSEAFGAGMRKFVGRFTKMGDKEWGSILSQLSTAMQFMADPRVVAATNESSFRLSEIVKGRSTVYIVIPDGQMEVQAAWLRLMLGAVSEAYKRYTPASDGIRGMLLIDEFPTLGRADVVVRDIGIVRGAGLDMTLVVQGLNQLIAIYGEHQASVIVSQCSWQWWCNIGDFGTAETLSKALGQMTVQTVSQTINAGDGSMSRNMGEMGRSLLFPDEIRALGRKIAFAFNPTERPHYIVPVMYEDLRGYLTGQAMTHVPPCILPDLAAYDENPMRKKSGGAGEGAKSPPPGSKGGMTTKEALEILGLTEGADQKAIRAAYKSLMTKVHPDMGGSEYFAKQLNEARRILLGK